MSELSVIGQILAKQVFQVVIAGADVRLDLA